MGVVCHTRLTSTSEKKICKLAFGKKETIGIPSAPQNIA